MRGHLLLSGLDVLQILAFVESVAGRLITQGLHVEEMSIGNRGSSVACRKAMMAPIVECNRQREAKQLITIGIFVRLIGIAGINDLIKKEQRGCYCLFDPTPSRPRISG